MKSPDLIEFKTKHRDRHIENKQKKLDDEHRRKMKESL